jgi:hypothetical protein
MNPRHLLAMTDFQFELLKMSASQLPVSDSRSSNLRDLYLRLIGLRRPINDTEFVAAITFALRTLGYAEDGSKLITHQTTKGDESCPARI